MFSYPSHEDYAALHESGLFLADWYCAEHAAFLPKNADPLMDFCARGWRAGHAPNPYFDVAFYLSTNPDVARARLNPLLHYLRQGDREGRLPCPRFDPAWYRATYVLDEFDNTLAHYLAHRFTGRVSPGPGFDPVRYLRTHPALMDTNTDPFLHAQAVLDGEQIRDDAIVEVAGLFDATHYLLENPDVREARRDPLSHFCDEGWREQRNPNLYFDTVFYQNQFGGPDMPLVHYYLVGEPAGLPPCRHFDPAWYARTYDIPPARSALRHYLENRRTQRYSPNAGFDVVEYVDRMGAHIGPNRDPFMHFLRQGKKNVLF